MAPIPPKVGEIQPNYLPRDEEQALQFAGQFEHIIDPKGRLNVASKIRQVLALEQPDPMGFWVTIGADGCLCMYSPKTWEKLTSHFPDDPLPPERERDIERWFFANADFLELDKSGRCILPDGLKKEVGISDKVVLVGVRNRVEAWAPDRWEAFKARVGPNYSRTIEVIHQLAAAKQRPQS